MCGKVRKDFEVIYKVDITKPEDLEAHMKDFAVKLGGAGPYVGYVLIRAVEPLKQNPRPPES